MEGHRSVNVVVEETRRSQANVSKHLKMLAEAGLVAWRKEGLQVYYRLDDSLVRKLCTLVCETIMQDAQRQLRESGRSIEKLGGTR